MKICSGIYEGAILLTVTTLAAGDKNGARFKDIAVVLIPDELGVVFAQRPHDSRQILFRLQPHSGGPI